MDNGLLVNALEYQTGDSFSTKVFIYPRIKRETGVKFADAGAVKLRSRRYTLYAIRCT